MIVYEVYERYFYMKIYNEHLYRYNIFLCNCNIMWNTKIVTLMIMWFCNYYKSLNKIDLINIFVGHLKQIYVNQVIHWNK